MNNRNHSIDILKGIGIILVVSFHSNAPFGHFMNLFFMAIFFIASGYCYNTEHYKDFASMISYFIKLMRRLYVPYIIYNLFLLVFHNLFVNNSLLDDGIYNVSDYLKRIPLILLFMGSELWAGATWFIRALFFALISFTVCGFIFRKTSPQVRKWFYYLLTVILLLSLWVTNDRLNTQIVNNIKFIVGAFVLIYIGHEISAIKYLSEFDWKKCVISFAVLLFLNQFRTITWGLYYGNPFFFLAASFSGWYFIGGISFYCSKISGLRSILCYIGRNSIVILFLHFMAFKVVSFAQIKMKSMEIGRLSEFPIIDEGDIIWRIIYIVGGVAIPLILHEIYRVVKNARNNYESK